MVLFFPMLPQWLPPGRSVQSPPRSGNFSAQTSASFHPSSSAAPAPLSLCCTGSLTLCCTGAPAGRQPHGRLKLCAVPAPRAGNTSWAPQALRCTGAPCRQHLMGVSSSALYRRPRAGNKPHLAAKSTPVWLVIWRTWAGFANSQLRSAAFRSTY